MHLFNDHWKKQQRRRPEPMAAFSTGQRLSKQLECPEVEQEVLGRCEPPIWGDQAGAAKQVGQERWGNCRVEGSVSRGLLVLSRTRKITLGLKTIVEIELGSQGCSPRFCISNKLWLLTRPFSLNYPRWITSHEVSAQVKVWEQGSYLGRVRTLGS